MIAAGKLARSALTAATLMWLAGCTSDKPDKATPWVVVLDEAPNRNLAVRLAGQYPEKYPERLEEAAALSFLEQDTVRHLIVSHGFASREKARSLSAKLEKSTPVKLKVIDTTSLRAVGEDEAEGVSTPEDAEQLEQLAALLPEPVEARLDSFLLITKTDLSRRSPLRPFGYGCPRKWWLA
jgi:hypothetical protein